jgi:cyanophycin synthetase
VVQYAAFKRNLLVTQVSSYFFSASDGSRTVSFWGHTPETTSLVARRVSNSKHLTKMVLQSAGLNVPEGTAYAADDEAVALNFAKRLGPPVVVKPVSGSGGRGRERPC